MELVWVMESTTLPVVLLDPRKLKLLRSEANSVLKNDLMMLVLVNSQWDMEYKTSLEAYRAGNAPVPQYPTARVERVETLVDEPIRESVDASHVR